MAGLRHCGDLQSARLQRVLNAHLAQRQTGDLVSIALREEP